MKMKHKEKIVPLPFYVSLTIIKKINHDIFYDGSLQKSIDSIFLKKFNGKYSCYAKPFGFFSPNKEKDSITGIDFIVYKNNKNGDFVMNLFFEVNENNLWLHYMGRNTKNSKKECIKLSKELLQIICRYKKFKLFGYNNLKINFKDGRLYLC